MILILLALLELVSQPMRAGFPPPVEVGLPGPSRAEGSRPVVRLEADPPLVLKPVLVSQPASGAAASTARIIPIAESAWAGSSINVVANIRHSVFTHGRVQFAAYYDADGVMVLAKRQIGADQWETRRSAHEGNVVDTHNAISLAVDGAGVLHVAWDHHGSPLNYARGTSPGSLELGSKQAMTGLREARVTYPQFHRLPGGDLLFLYRDGVSGQGTLMLNRYAIASGAWTAVQANLIDGEGVRSPYWDMAVDRTGTLHLAWLWRDSPDVATNHDLCYARSADEGRTWTRSDGAPVKLPMTAGAAEYAVRIPRNSNLMNSPAIAVDDNGRPYITTYWSPGPGTPPRFHVIHHDGTAWRTIEGPSREHAFTLSGSGTRRPPISRAVVLVEPVGAVRQIHLIYRDDARGAAPRIVAATREWPGTGAWTERELTTEPVGAWEPGIDPTAWARFRQVHMLVQQVAQRDGDDRIGAIVPPAPVATLVWSPVAERLSAMPTTPAPPVDPSALDRPLAAGEVLAIMQRVADWQLANPPDPSRRPPTGWETAPFYIGALALDAIAPDRRYRDAMVSQGAANGWQPHRRLYHADDYCVTQSYLELHRQLGDPAMLAPTKARFDEILAHPPSTPMEWGEPRAQDRWTWCDALFMAPVAWLQMWKATGDARYLDYMNREWWATTTSLFLPATGFYFRDESFLDLREPNGKTVHWARGNGWVFAGLSRVLDVFPADHPDYPRYRRLYVDMAAAVLAAQQADGLWRPGLLDPVAHPARETSGSSFFTFGLAWGVNRGLLDRARVESSVRRAWNALTDCVTAEGRLEHVQPIGAAPHGFDPHSTEPFAVGAFLLAGSEVHRLAQQAPHRLTVEYLVAPVVDEAKPRLGWQLPPTPGTRGERQTAYHVLVASSPELLARDTGDLWDSGKVASSLTSQLLYDGRPLQPGQTAYWKVRAWDAEDRLSAWSATSTWSAGLLDPANWRAEWIASPARPPAPLMWTDRAWLDGGVDHEPFGEAVRAFRVPIEIPRDRAIRDVVLRFAATARTRIHIDGRFLHAPHRQGYVETVDVTGLLGPGWHVLAISVGPGPRANPQKPAPFPAQALVGEVVVTAWSGETLAIPLGRSTKTQVFEAALPARWETSGYDDGEWIAARVAVRGTELRDFQATLAPATFVRTTFDVDKPVRRALLRGSALGNYELRLNGARVGRDHFTPGFTDYAKTLYYNTYDVTTGVRRGRNALGAIVADGWYAGYVGYRSVPGTFGARHAVSAVLDLEFADGTRRHVVTDRTWRASTGPILAADHLHGYAYDARREQSGWDTPGFGATSWGPVEILPPPAARLSAYPSEPVREMRTLAARAVTQPVPGVYVADFGQNLVGWVRLGVQGRAGRKVVIRHGEMLNADGTVYTENLRSARATDVFFAKGGPETFEPKFTFHGFRYASITGLDKAPAPDSIRAVVVHNDLIEAGAFASSDDLVNRIFANTLWGQRGNYLEVPTDCPQRDERLGWMGDAQVFARTAAYNMDVAAFLTKWLVDVRDAQLPEGAFSNISPRLPDEPRPGAPGWGDAGVIVPWTLYRQYGDLRVLERHYDAMTRWIAWIAGENPDHLWTKRLSSNYGDWLSPEGVGVKELYATAYYAYSTHLVAETARVLGKADDARRYAELRDRIRQAFTQTYVAPDGRLQGDTQTAYLLALKFDLVPQQMRATLAARLFERLAARDGHLGTGFLGVNVLLPTLTDLGRTDAAYQLLTKTTYPSWGYSIVNGATTIWERWDSYTREKGFGSVGMNSFNHYAYGSVVEWLYTTVLGIDALEPGFSRIVIKPQPGAPLQWARGHYDSIHGRIASEWRLEAGRLALNVTIPPNTTAEIHVPAKDEALVTEGGRLARQSPGLTWLRAENGYIVFEVGSGEYAFEVALPR